MDLKKQLVSIENDLEWPGLINEAENEIDLTIKLTEEEGNDQIIKNAKAIAPEIRKAIETQDAHLLNVKWWKCMIFVFL